MTFFQNLVFHQIVGSPPIRRIDDNSMHVRFGRKGFTKTWSKSKLSLMSFTSSAEIYIVAE